MSYGYKLRNIHLFPDPNDADALAFRRATIQLSGTLNRLHPSGYEVVDKPSPANPRVSAMHATLMHVLVSEDPKIKTAFHKTLAPFLNRLQNVNVYGYISLPRLPQFNRDAIEQFGVKHLMQEGKIHNLHWLTIAPGRELLDLQQSIFGALSAVLPYDFCFTARGENYKPHFTLWLEETAAASPSHPIGSVNWGDIPTGSVPCRVGLGDCGILGQVQSYDVA